MPKKIIVITGAAGGVGSMLSWGLAKKGNHIVCLGRTETSLKKLVNEINVSVSKDLGGSASYLRVDMMDNDSVVACGRKIMDEFHQIDVWINNVGEMSNPQDSVDLIDILMSGKADQLGGRYFFSDDKNID